jgi:DNA repair protein RadD
LIICPACGFRPAVKHDVNRRGNLIEFSRNAVRAEPSEEEKRIFYAELRWIANDSGYKPGWAAHRYNDRFGSRPPWEWNQDPTARPTATTRALIRAQQTAYATRMTAAR